MQFSLNLPIHSSLPVIVICPTVDFHFWFEASSFQKQVSYCHIPNIGEFSGAQLLKLKDYKTDVISFQFSKCLNIVLESDVFIMSFHASAACLYIC